MTQLASDEGPTAIEQTKTASTTGTTNSMENGIAPDESTIADSLMVDEALQHDKQCEQHKSEPIEQGSREQQIEITYNEVDVPSALQTTAKKNRLVSIDSGFGSFGPSEMNVVAISSEASTAVTFPVHSASPFDMAQRPKSANNFRISTACTGAGDANTPPPSAAVAVDPEIQCEKQDKLAPLEQPPMRRLSDSAGRADKGREYRKNRTTTLTNNDEANAELDVRLINRNDGLKNVMCYLDEDGAPRVRDKNPKRKSTLKQELKNRNLGASLDGEALMGIQKKPSCVSFSRLCQKFKESFLSKCQFSLFELIARTTAIRCALHGKSVKFH